MIVPGMGLSGVANQELDIEDARRTPQAIAPVLSKCGLQPAQTGEFRAWLEARNRQGTTKRSVA